MGLEKTVPLLDNVHVRILVFLLVEGQATANQVYFHVFESIVREYARDQMVKTLGLPKQLNFFDIVRGLPTKQDVLDVGLFDEMSAKSVTMNRTDYINWLERRKNENNKHVYAPSFPKVVSELNFLESKGFLTRLAREAKRILWLPSPEFRVFLASKDGLKSLVELARLSPGFRELAWRSDEAVHGPRFDEQGKPLRPPLW